MAGKQAGAVRERKEISAKSHKPGTESIHLLLPKVRTGVLGVAGWALPIAVELNP